MSEEGKGQAMPEEWQRIAMRFADPANEPRRKIAERLCALSEARLECGICRREETLTIEKTLHYLAHGWPRCCGEIMSIHTGTKT